MKRSLLIAVSASLLSLSAASFAEVTTQYSMVTDLTGSDTATGAARPDTVEERHRWPNVDNAQFARLANHGLVYRLQQAA